MYKKYLKNAHSFYRDVTVVIASLTHNMSILNIFLL